MPHDTESPMPDQARIDEAQERYRVEREKRLRTDGQAQYSALTDEYEDFNMNHKADWFKSIREGHLRQSAIKDGQIRDQLLFAAYKQL